jgi:recombinational DNA repair protein (RecF pathway)
VRAVSSLFHPEEAQPYIYLAVKDSWKIWPTCNEEQSTMLEVALYLMVLKQAGYQPQLNNCQVCGTVQAAESVVLDERMGGWACVTCRSSLAEAANSIAGDGLKIIKYLAEKPNLALRLVVSRTLSKQIEDAMRMYMGGVVDSQRRNAPVKNLR